MVIYGVGLLAFCYLAGVILGDGLGLLLGVQANVGGVGIAMLLLIILSSFKTESWQPSPLSSSGIQFWSAIYIPIVVAMAAKQNVIAALSSSWLAIIAGTLAVAACFALVPVLARFVPAEDTMETNDG